MTAIYACRASATDKSVLLAIAHTGDWSDLAAPRPAANEYLAAKTGLARSTVIAAIKRLVDGGVLLSVRRFALPPLRTILWPELESYVSIDGHMGGVRKRAADPQAGDEPVDNPVDDGGKPSLRPVAGQLQKTGGRSTIDRQPVHDRPVSGLLSTGGRSQSGSLPERDRDLVVERENAREARLAENRRTRQPADSSTAPPWLLKLAVQHRRPPADLANMVTIIGQHLRADAGVTFEEMLSDGPTLLGLWSDLGAPDTVAFAVEASLVADAFHRCPDPLFSRYVRSEHNPDFPNQCRSAAQLANRQQWAQRVAVARTWDAAGRPPNFRASAHLANRR